MVDLEAVSIFNDWGIEQIVKDEKRYNKTPFLFLIASYVRNKSLAYLDKNLTYLEKKQTGAWMVYCFEKKL